MTQSKREGLRTHRFELVVHEFEELASGPSAVKRTSTSDFIYNPLHYLALLEQKTRKLALRDLL